MERSKIHHAIHGKIHYFNWAIFNSYHKSAINPIKSTFSYGFLWFPTSLPEGNNPTRQFSESGRFVSTFTCHGVESCHDISGKRFDMKTLDDKWMNVDGITSNLCCLPTKKRMKSSAGIS